MAENTNGANAPEEEGSKKKGFKETAKGVWNFVTTNPVTKTAGKILLGIGLIGAGAFLGGVGVGIKEEHAKAKSERAEEGEETVILSDPEYEALVESEEADEAPEEAPIEEQAE